MYRFELVADVALLMVTCGTLVQNAAACRHCAPCLAQTALPFMEEMPALVKMDFSLRLVLFRRMEQGLNVNWMA
jgi:hypothetical protein